MENWKPRACCEAPPLEQQVTASQVRLQLQALSCQPEEMLVVVEMECSLVPRQDAVTDLVRVGESRTGFRLRQIHERGACREHERTEDSLPRSWFLCGDVGREVADVHDGVESHGLGEDVEGSGDVAQEPRLLQGPLSGGENLPPDQFIEFVRAQSVVPS